MKMVLAFFSFILENISTSLQTTKRNIFFVNISFTISKIGSSIRTCAYVCVPRSKHFSSVSSLRTTHKIAFLGRAFPPQCILDKKRF